MARVIGIDLGAHSVKVTALDVGFRAVQVSSVRTFEVLGGSGSSLERSLAALEAFDDATAEDGVTVALPGDRVLLRLLDIPVTDPRKLQAIVGNELADEMPWEMEDVVYDHRALRAPVNKVLAAAARTAEIELLLDGLQSRGIVARHVAVASLSYSELIRRLYPSGLIAVVDIGHLRTNICLVDGGKVLFGRTISRGGHQVTEALRQVLQLPYQEAEVFKEAQAQTTTKLDELGARDRQLVEVVNGALAPLSRELAQSLTISQSRIGQAPKGLVLCGGGCLLRGMRGYLSSQLRLPVTRLSLAGDQDLEVAGLGEEGEVVGALSLGLALEHTRKPVLELRQGQFAFQSDVSIFRDKFMTLAAAVLAVLIFAGISAYAKLAALRSEETALEQRLERETRTIFRSPILSPDKIQRMFKQGRKAANFSIPAKTAVDMLDLLSQRIPKDEETTVDVTRLDIKQGKIYAKGTANSQSAVGKMVKALKEDDCFSEVSPGKISRVADGKMQFTLNIVSKCF